MKIVVLMSTYNGAAFLEPQIRSILDQDLPNGSSLSLIIRDDGSSDATPRILERLAARNPRIEVRLGKNLGLPQAYFELLRDCPPDADLYLFSDQDDIWHADKIRAAMHEAATHDHDTPFLYCSRVRLMAENGTTARLSPDRPQPPSFGNALIENICTGCTTAFNSALLTRIRQTTSHDAIMFHDWWAYLVAAAFGSVIFDPTPRVDYRLHGRNVTGMPMNNRDAYRRRLKQQRVGDRFANLLAQARVFHDVYGDDLTLDQRRLMGRLLALKDSRRAAFGLIGERAIFRQGRRDDFAWRVALGLYGAGVIGAR